MLSHFKLFGHLLRHFFLWLSTKTKYLQLYTLYLQLDTKGLFQFLQTLTYLAEFFHIADKPDKPT